MSSPPLKIGDRVRYRGVRSGSLRGVIVRDRGVQTPAHSSAPLADQWPPEQVWEVEFTFAGIKDVRGCWESDLERIEPEREVKL